MNNKETHKLQLTAEQVDSSIVKVEYVDYNYNDEQFQNFLERWHKAETISRNEWRKMLREQGEAK